MKHYAFTMVELIFVIVIIGILASIAVPKLGGVRDGAKKTAEIATISAVATALESAHGEWSINEGEFTWGNNHSSNDDFNNTTGYPTKLGDDDKDPFNYVLKRSNKEFKKYISGNPDNISIFTGPASDPEFGVNYDSDAPNSDIPGKPDKNDFWIYAHSVSSTGCTESKTSKLLYSGDFVLIDINDTTTTTYPSVTCN